MENDQNYFDTEVFEAKHMKKTILRFIRSMGKQKWRLTVVFICIAFYTYFTVMAPLYSADVVDLIWNQMKEAMQTGQHFQITWEFGGRQLFSLLLMFLACGIFYSLQSFLMANFAEKLNLQLRGEISEKLNCLPLSYFDRQQPGAIMSRAGLRQAFGMVLQDTWLFEGTIAENIAYGKPDASREEIIAAAKAARADFFIRTLPKGYDTVLGSDAETISAGQRQLLTIARVMLCDPAILILDEATSSVDTRTEMEISLAMNTLMKGRTSFVIAHRLSTIVDADLILVMQNGTIIEQGNHKRLLESGGAYAELYNSQFA